MHFSKKAIIRCLFGEATVVGDLAYPIVFDDVPWWKALIGVIPLGGIVYFFGDGSEEDGEDNEDLNQDSNKYKENGQTVMPDGGRDNMNQNNGNSTVGNNRAGINQGVYEDISMDTPRGRLNSLTEKIPTEKSPVGKKALLALAAIAVAAGGFFLGQPLIAVGGLASAGIVYGVYSKWGTKGLMFGAVPLLIFGAVIAFTGVGAGYGNMLDDTFGGYTAGLGDIGGEIQYQVGQAASTLACFGSYGCIQEWQMNQTQRPGSEDAGETYELDVEELSITTNSQYGVDVAYKQKDAPIPIYFVLKNTRHGIKGITARNVQYRFNIRDERLVGGTDLCSTEWKDLNKYGENADLPSSIDNNDLLPGDAVQPLNYAGDDRLTLEECGLLQPSAGSNVNLELQIRYDYSSQSTLQLEAMSSSHRIDQGIDINSGYRSETADTPVETFIQTRSPITFQNLEEKRVPTPFTAQIGVHTDENNIHYRINEEAFKIEDSSKTVPTDSCDGLTPVPGKENTYKLSEEVITSIRAAQEEDWFSQRSYPPEASCTFTLENPNSISATGETLTMSADVNYTVLQQELHDSFQVSNSLCTDYNCPMLVAIQPDELTQDIATSRLGEELTPEDEDYWTKDYAMCNDNRDAQPGCSVIESFSLEDRTAGPITDTTIERGDIALKLSSSYQNNGNNFYTCHVENQVSGEFNIVSIQESQLEEVWRQNNRALNYTESDGWVITDITDNDPHPGQSCEIPNQQDKSGSSGSSDSSDTGSKVDENYVPESGTAGTTYN